MSEAGIPREGVPREGGHSPSPDEMPSLASIIAETYEGSQELERRPRRASLMSQGTPAQGEPTQGEPTQGEASSAPGEAGSPPGVPAGGDFTDAVLRVPEGTGLDLGTMSQRDLERLETGDFDLEGYPEPQEDETMILNMGPQHPSTHGVLRLMIELDGETVLRTKPVIGYLHTGMEKTGEELTYVQGATNVTRMDYLSPLNNELVYALATEDLLGVEIPERAVWIRMLMSELQRVSSHLMWLATNGMDLGSTTAMIFGFREREVILAFFQKVTGLRMNHDYIRPGGVAADLPDGWEEDVAHICELIPRGVDEIEELLSGQPIFRERTEGVGVITPEVAVAMSATGPILRSTGVPWDLRRAMPYLAYDQVDFDVVVGTYGDVYDRYAVRLNEVRESIGIISQVLEKMPEGDYRVQDRKVTPPPRARIDESMEGLIHHFKIFTEGFHVPEGETYVAIESPRGELGCYMVSDGSNKPYRMHIRGPSFVNLQSAPVMMRGGLVADAIAIVSSVDPVMGEVDR